LKIGFEAISLSEQNLTGIGNVTFQIINNILSLDKNIKYYVFSLEEVIHKFNTKQIIYCLVKRPFKNGLEICTNKLKIEKFIIFYYYWRLLKSIFIILDTITIHLNIAIVLRKHRIDAYIGFFANFFPIYIPNGIKKYWVIYDLVWKFYPETMKINQKIYNFLIHYNMKRCDALFSISENTSNDLRFDLKIKNKIHTALLAADANIFFPAKLYQINNIKKKYNIRNDYILSVSTIEPRKNIDIILRACSMIDNKKINIVLVGAIGWASNRITKIIEQLGIKDRVILTGFVNEKELSPLYSGAKAFLFPSIYEGFGLPVLEAMQCGCPVIASNCSSIPEIVGDAGILLDPNNIIDWITTINNVLSNMKLSLELTKRGIIRAQKFSWKNTGKIFLNEIKFDLTK
jgi:glycosyltransferase involved in cell wall biosynthesis